MPANIWEVSNAIVLPISVEAIAKHRLLGVGMKECGATLPDGTSSEISTASDVMGKLFSLHLPPSLMLTNFQALSSFFARGMDALHSQQERRRGSSSRL